MIDTVLQKSQQIYVDYKQKGKTIPRQKISLTTNQFDNFLAAFQRKYPAKSAKFEDDYTVKTCME